MYPMTQEKMRSVVRTKYGSPNILSIQEIDRPRPKDNELLIQVHASTVNRTDCGALWGAPFIFRFFVGFPRPRHLATGSDFAGEVVEVGMNVTRFKKGDRVFGFNDHGLGSHAQYMTIVESPNVAVIPASVSYVQAAASLEGAHYAYNFISKVRVEKGSKVIVNGGTGGIGSAAIQMLNYLGAEVDAVCATEYLEKVGKLGAVRVFDYTREDFTKQNSGLYDFVFDAVGKSSFGACKLLLKPDGVYISSELGPNFENPFLALLTPVMGRQRVVFPVPVDIPRTIQHMQMLLERRQFNPLIDREYPLDKIAEAFEYVASGHKIGNVVINNLG
ncbi:MAG: NAD(P)-dependent alcohol dehydrogenase [Bdellovibrionaceae bacterium]|nr:NAD(P)-dependent alcohol dehydrogenase [Pseudobdellovibrionaceae bacterium]